MSKDKPNLDKLRKLCQELSDRDAQLKVNASTLWEVVKTVSEAKKLLAETVSCDCKSCDCNSVVKIKKTLEKLDEAVAMIDTKGCRRIQNGH